MLLPSTEQQLWDQLWETCTFFVLRNRGWANSTWEDPEKVIGRDRRLARTSRGGSWWLAVESSFEGSGGVPVSEFIEYQTTYYILITYNYGYCSHSLSKNVQMIVIWILYMKIEIQRYWRIKHLIILKLWSSEHQTGMAHRSTPGWVLIVSLLKFHRSKLYDEKVFERTRRRIQGPYGQQMSHEKRGWSLQAIILRSFLGILFNAILFYSFIKCL